MSDEIRVVLLGKTGSGKSSLGNTLLGREVFRVASGLSSGTEKCQWADSERFGKLLNVTDTPGLCDTHRSEEEVLREIGKSVAVASPGPHVILMVLRCDKRFTDEEFQAYQSLKKLFGPNIRRHMIIVFSGADTYGRGIGIEQQTSKLKNDIAKSSGQLKEVLADADNRFVAVDNTATGADRETYAKEVMKMMLIIVKNNHGDYFKSKLCEEVNKLVEPMIQANTSGNTTRAKATRLTNEAIVNETVGGTFLKNLMKIMGKAVEKVVERVVEIGTPIVVNYIASKCSLM